MPLAARSTRRVPFRSRGSCPQQRHYGVHNLYQGFGFERADTYAGKIGAVIVTKDEDFVVRRVLQEGPAIVWVRIGNTRRAELLRRIEADFSAIVAALERGETLVEIA